MLLSDCDNALNLNLKICNLAIRIAGDKFSYLFFEKKKKKEMKSNLIRFRTPDLQGSYVGFYTDSWFDKYF